MKRFQLGLCRVTLQWHMKCFEIIAINFVSCPDYVAAKGMRIMGDTDKGRYPSYR